MLQVRELWDDVRLRLIPRGPIALALALACGAVSMAAPQPDPAASVVTLTNHERAREKRPPLAANARLMKAAQLHADQMARAGRLDHELRGVRYPRAEDRLKAAGYAWQGWAENIASGQPTPVEVLRSWMKSKPHRKNILEPSMREIGVGVATDRSGRLYWVQLFGRPLPQAR